MPTASKDASGGGNTPPILSLGIPCFETFKIETTYSLLSALPAVNRAVHLNFRKGPYVHVNRERIVADALRVGAAHLMFIDTDMTFQPDAISRLLAADKDIIGAPANMKALPRQSNVKMLAANGTYGDVEITSSEPFQCAAIGTGFMLIDLKRLAEKMSSPYFTFAERDGEVVGEDVHFCERARSAGLEVWCDPTIQVGHVGDFIY